MKTQEAGRRPVNDVNPQRQLWVRIDYLEINAGGVVLPRPSTTLHDPPRPRPVTPATSEEDRAL